MTGPVIRGRAGRTPLPLMPPANYPVSGLPLSAVSHFCTFAQAAGRFAPLHNPQARQHSTSWPSLTCTSTHLTFPASIPHNFATATLYKSIWP